MLSSPLLLFTGIELGPATALLAQALPNKAADLSDKIITGAWGDPANCNSTNATPVAFLDAAPGHGIAKGECVLLSAYLAGRAIFASKADANLCRARVTAS